MAKNCKTITISDCPSVDNCVGCKEIIPLKCIECKKPTVTSNLFNFVDNGLPYQFLDVLKNATYTLPVTIQIVSVNFGGNRAVESFNSIYYKHPIIKLTKPALSANLLNIDTPESFTYKITDACGNSNIATTVLLTATQIILDEYIFNNTIIP